MLCLNLFENLEKVNILSHRSFNIFNVIFVILAACIATLGFLYNSTDAILGSMLVSAITNPLLTFIILFLLNQYSTSFIKMFHFFGLVLVAIIISVLAGYMNQRYKIDNDLHDPWLALRSDMNIRTIVCVCVCILKYWPKASWGRKGNKKPHVYGRLTLCICIVASI